MKPEHHRPSAPGPAANRAIPAPVDPPSGPPLWGLLQATATALQAIQKGQSGTAALEAIPAKLRPGAQALLFHALRHWGRAQALRSHLAARKPGPAVDALLCAALALTWDDKAAPYPPFTLVDQAVEAAKRTPAIRAQAAFLNACLRRFLREREALVLATDADPVARWNHPLWWIRRVQQDHPQHWEAVLTANNQHPPMALRVNASKTTLDQYIQALIAINLEAYPVGESGLLLAKPAPVHALPGFAQGLVSVQDLAAQQAAPLLLQGLPAQGDAPLRVLDACAAPGGKTAHLLEWASAHGLPVAVTALEIDAQRAQRIRETLERLQLQAQVLVADAAQPQAGWLAQAGGALFDAILLDAPCTASGIVRRHPDVRWLRRESDIAQLAAQQARLLAQLWPLVRPGGRLLYCTCSVFRAEGDVQIQAFLARNSDARALPSPGHLLPAGGEKSPGLPDNLAGDQDGFFYALLSKSPAAS